VENENEKVTDDDVDDSYSENNYYSRGSTDEEYDEDELRTLMKGLPHQYGIQTMGTHI